MSLPDATWAGAKSKHKTVVFEPATSHASSTSKFQPPLKVEFCGTAGAKKTLPSTLSILVTVIADAPAVPGGTLIDGKSRDSAKSGPSGIAIVRLAECERDAVLPVTPRMPQQPVLGSGGLKIFTVSVADPSLVRYGLFRLMIISA